MCQMQFEKIFRYFIEILTGWFSVHDKIKSLSLTMEGFPSEIIEKGSRLLLVNLLEPNPHPLCQ